MRVASLPQRRDGRLIVVSSDLAWYADADHIVPTLQGALDDWDRLAPLLETLAIELDHGAIPRLRFHEREASAPLPRAYQWADGSGYLAHVDLVRRAGGAQPTGDLPTEPLIYQGGSDDLRPGRSAIRLADEAWGADFEAEICVVTGDVPQGASRAEALAAIRLVGLANDVSLRRLAAGELASGFGFLQSKPATSFSPVFATPAALGPAWSDGRLHLPLLVDLNGQHFGRADAGAAMDFDFGTLIAHLAKTRKIGAGSIIGSGTVSNYEADGAPARPISAGGKGYSCLLEARTVEGLDGGKPVTPWLRHGDVVRIEMRDAKGHSLFGAIEQKVV